MKRRIWLSRISSSILSLRFGSIIKRIAPQLRFRCTFASNYTQALARRRGLDREGVKLACVGALAHGVLHQSVLVDQAEPIELGGADLDAQVIPAALVDDLHGGPRQGGLDERLDVVGESHGSGGRLGLRGLEQLLDPAELHARTAVRLAGLDLGGVDRLPALEGDVIGLSLREQRLDGAAIAGELRLRNRA